MPRTEHVISVFVASPDDLKEERAILERVIRELNIAWGRDLSVRLDLLMWETHAYPSVGPDPQAVINEQIGDEYDVFIGIMWQRFGTPTGRAGSGTEEEFQRAKARFYENSRSVDIMMYFKDGEISPFSADLDQLILVRNFRNGLKEEFYWKFKSESEFEDLIRLHLIRKIQEWRKNIGQKEPVPPATPARQPLVYSISVEEDESDLGLLDLIDIYEDNIDGATIVLGELNEAMSDLTEANSRSTASLLNIQEGITSRSSRTAAKVIISNTAQDMELAANIFREKSKQYSDHFETAMRAFITMAEISSSMANEDQSQERQRLKQKMDELDVNVFSAISGVSGFRNAVSALPRMTSDLNRAKRGLTTELDNLLSSWDESRRLVGEALAALRPS